MCGIVFTINADDYAYCLSEWFADAMLASQVRGTDSTGLFQLDLKGTSRLYKQTLPASNFLEHKEAQTIIRDASSSMLTVGHVRAATVGKVTQENAQPFRVTREDGSYVVVVHNGTLLNWHSKPGASSFTSDSAWVAYLLAEKGNDAFAYFDGSFAIVWYDSRTPDYVYMARNSKRPLHYAVVNGGETLVGCSELGMLGWLTDKYGLAPDPASKWPTPYYLEAGKVYKFSLHDVGNFTTSDYPDLIPFNTNLVPINKPVAQIPDKTKYLPWYDESYLEDEQESILDHVKELLKKARDGVVEEDTLPKKEVTIEHTSAIPFDSEENVDLVDTGSVILQTVNTASATKKEIESARSLKVLGMVVKFTGTLYDTQTSSLMGNFQLFENGSWVVYDAEMRFITREVAQQFMLDDNSNDGWDFAAIVGVIPDSVNSLSFVTPLTSDQIMLLASESAYNLPYATALAS